ncbi:hypothetical protein GYM62_06465 [Algoriphagus sp. NBT04N3]|jgi:hypothetical protein|uniref:hypothetical protein n=1 Tax=Algoriphagus sp. NBT04N3 TaxID=2705473 RepID=UPI001C633F96|nr:hypothetical protein [Algoriphagus sp. NBT04N3]QYH38459.1 hypothetical protein GYM62_06465 [Algoriphagus sp. NBT04N3]
MLSALISVNNVEISFHHLIHEERLNFHPDEGFENYINLETKRQTYTDEEAAIRNNLMEQAFQVCDRQQADIYQIGADLLIKYLTSKTTKK